MRGKNVNKFSIIFYVCIYTFIFFYYLYFKFKIDIKDIVVNNQLVK